MITLGVRALKGCLTIPVQHKYSIQLAHACPTMHRIHLVYEKSQLNRLVWDSLTLAPRT